MIIAMAGLPGAGKTSLARELARKTGGAILNKDGIRWAVFSAKDIEFSIKQDDFVMELMLQAAQYILQKTPDRNVFFDGRTFSRRYQIDRVLAFASELHQPWKIIECTCSVGSARNRLEAGNESHPARNRNFALYEAVKAHYEPITYPKTIVDTDHALEQCIKQAEAAISSN
jgi:predicted kinase